jgi:hypothetical protein
MRAPPQMIGVRVNRPAAVGAPTAARLCIASQRDIDALLRVLVELA